MQWWACVNMVMNLRVQCRYNVCESCSTRSSYVIRMVRICQELTCMFLICLFTTFRGSNFSSLLAIAVKRKVLRGRLAVSQFRKVKVKAIAGREGPWGCETSRLPHFLDSRLVDGGKVVSLTRRPLFTPQEDFWYSFLLEAESTPGP
jgi:hypothetical protein